MAKQSHKEQLFENVFQATRETIEILKVHFLIDIQSLVFGEENDGFDEKSKDFFRASLAGIELNELYEYAINGIVAGSQYDTHNYSDRSYIATNGEAVVEFLTSNHSQLSQEWHDLFWMADGRFSLDGGEDISLTKVALLGKVDLRTVRNAVSAGQLVTVTKEKMFEHDTVFVENTSARRWLLGRKGFKATPLVNTEMEQIGEVCTPAGFAAFLINQRKQIETDLGADDIANRSVNHPGVDQTAMKELESGVFSLHLDTVFPIADFYQVSRKDMLNCVLRTFFREEYQMLITTKNSK
jgi:hypothetical protein